MNDYGMALGRFGSWFGEFFMGFVCDFDVEDTFLWRNVKIDVQR